MQHAHSSSGANVPARQRVFGTPGASLIGAGRALNQQRAHQGRLGEERLAGLTRAVVDGSPDMLLFHSIKLPGETGDVDQLLYAGGTFYLMDAKLWKGFNGQRRVTYDVPMRDSETMVFVRDGQPFAGAEVKAPKQLHKWRRYLAGHRVLSVVVLMDPGAQVAPTASNPDVLVLNALHLQAWLRSLPVGSHPPLHEVWIRELAGLTFDPARAPQPRARGRTPRAVTGQRRPQDPWTPTPPSIPLPRVAAPSPSPSPQAARSGSSAMAYPTPPAPPALMRPRARRRSAQSGRRSLACVLLAWVTWVLTFAMYWPTQSASVLAHLALIASLALTINAIVLGAKGVRRARRTATSRAASGWGLGLGIAHLTVGFVAPVLTSLGFLIASQA